MKCSSKRLFHPIFTCVADATAAAAIDAGTDAIDAAADAIDAAALRTA